MLTTMAMDMVQGTSLLIFVNGLDDNCNGLEDDQGTDTGIKLKPFTTAASCNGSEDGSITLDISGGKPPYAVFWSNGLTGDTLTDLAPGFYSGFVTDSSGCIFSIPLLEIESQALLNVVNTGLVAPTCQGKTDGAIFIEHNTNFPPYTYEWSDGSTTKYLTETGEGVYSVTVTDANHCFSVLKNLMLNARPSLTTNIKKILQPLCYGQSTGQVELITLNGLPPYQYAWNHGPTGPAVNNLSEGIYVCVITDALGCKQSFPVSIKPPGEIEISVISTEDVRCFGEENGSVKTNVKGGKTPYTYFWNHFEFTDDLFELAAGEYTLTVTDAHGCRSTSQPIVIRQPEPLQLTIDSLTAATCRNGSNGRIFARATGGNGDYNFLWSHSDLNVSGFNNLSPGNYSITTYDQFGCKTSIPGVTVDFVNKPLTLTAFVKDSIRCHQSADGSIEVAIGTGKGPYDLNWSHGLQYFSATGKETVNSLKPGNYQLTVTDSEGCTGLSEVLLLADKPALLYELARLQQNTCAGDSAGSIAIKVTGGTPPVQVTWNNGAFNGILLDQLWDGAYQGKARDQLGCINEFAPILLTPLSDLKIQAKIQHVTAASPTGSICLELDGGRPPYSFVWSNGSNSGPCLAGLLAGAYSVTITDDLGCETSDIFLVEKSNAIEGLESHGVKIFPNPASENIEVQTPWPVRNCRMFSSAGTEVRWCSEVNFKKENLAVFDVSCLMPGLYFIQFVSDSGRSVALPFAVVN
ncbi:MAG: hypothetical protein LW630_10100 [Saprospiraceae bacterium]|nr:hypothetical protein [Saprospiraceae bacterium]